MKTVLFGGTFDPIHIGHLHLADTLRTEYGYEQIIMVPSYIPPHKDRSLSVSPKQRYLMVKAAAEPEGFIVDPFEIESEGISYTYRSVEHLYASYPVSEKLSLVVGDDLVDGLSSWKEWEKIVDRVDLLIARREASESLPCPWPHTYLDNAVLPISSSDIRERIGQGRAYRYLVPEAVGRIIQDTGLYR